MKKAVCTILCLTVFFCIIPITTSAKDFTDNAISVSKEILALDTENKRKIFDDLEWGFKNIKYKVESLPNYNELKEKLKDLKEAIRLR